MSKPIRDPSALSIYRPGLFNGKVAVVTGGGTGIGKSIAHELAMLGCTVVIAARNAERLNAAADAIRAELGTTIRNDAIYTIVCDIRNEAQVNNLIDETLAKFHRIDFLVNNAGSFWGCIQPAGGQFRALTKDISPKGWEAVIRTNLTGTFLVTKKAFHAYMQQHGGNIVNIILVMENGYPFMAHSAAARAGIQNLTKSLAVEWADSGITLNCVAPGIILSSGADNYAGGAEVFVTAAEKVTTAKRVGSVEEVSAGVLFYLTPAAQYTTGTTLHVDGGWHLMGPLLDIEPHTNSKAYGTCKL